MNQHAETDLIEIDAWPFLDSWESLIRFLIVDNDERDALHPATVALRRLMYHGFRELRRCLEDPKFDQTTWESPFISVDSKRPLDAQGEAIRDAQPLFDLVTAGRAAVKKDGSTFPLLPGPLFQSFLNLPAESFQRCLDRWVDIEAWTQPVSYGDEAGRSSTILGCGGEARFSASLVFEIHPKTVDLDDNVIRDALVVGLPWEGDLPPGEWAEKTQDSMWKTVSTLLQHLSRGAKPSKIRIEVPGSPLFSYFEVSDKASRDFSRQASFRVEKTVLANVPPYARGLTGPVLDIADGNGNLRYDSGFIVCGTMLYPDDLKRREEFIAAHRAKFLLDFERSFIDCMIEEGRWAEEELRKHAWRLIQEEYDINSKDTRYLLGSPSFNDQVRRASPRMSEGSVVGDMLQFMLGCSRFLPEHLSVSKAAYIMSNVLRGEVDHRGKKVNCGLSTVKNAWCNLRDVAHLWAAYMHWIQDQDQDPFWAPWNEPVFLAVAEYFREEGERCFARAQEAKHGPILDPTRTWRPPPELVLPVVDFDWSPTTGGWVPERLAEYQPQK